MNKIETLIKEFCPDGVEWKEIGDVIDYEQPTKYLVSSKEYSNDYSLPVLTAGQSFILGYTNETEGVYEASKEHPVIIFDDFTTSKKWVNFNFKVKSTAMKILKVKSGISNILIRFVWHYLGTITYSPDQHGRQWISTYSKFKIPVPPLEIQEEIVKILDKFTDYVTELTTELTLRQKQYNYYRDKLYIFEGEKVDWKKLGEIATIQRGASPRPISKFLTENEDGVPWIKIGDTNVNSKFVENTNQKITKEGAKKSRLLKKGDFILSNSMSFGRPYILKINGAIHDGWASISDFEDSVISDYLYHYLVLNKTQQYWASKINSGSVSNLNSEIIKSLNVPIPSFEVQSKIVKFLDYFNELTSNLSEGLPKEIELRQKQYEYYRDKLLTFD
ncbi:putative type-1 restriction enzyme specificity protein [Streptococcus parauberis]|uniref:restriction endonuclease subunit S n=1 Tax=Streptococcus parauberis TaxID=1348 RepID=UPI000CCFB6A9|nr:restriction endonuclease subunit S [Streptococcus parauberis]PNY22115.1 putative type-1 restriction enzyme specificity protein [Streptococcus parauberis]